jgi:hypothetical protein
MSSALARAASSASATTSGRASCMAVPPANAVAFAPKRARMAVAAPSPSSSPTTPSFVARAGSDAPAAPLVAPKPPQGVSMPPRQPDVPEPRFGFVDWAEKINGRACMIGFFALLLVEGITSKPLLQVMGFTVGQGLGFEL